MSRPEDRPTARLNAAALKARANDIDSLTRILHHEGNDLTENDHDVVVLRKLLLELGWHESAIAIALANSPSIKDTAQRALDVLSIDIIQPATPRTEIGHIIDALIKVSPLAARALRSGIFDEIFDRLANMRVKGDQITDGELMSLFEMIDLMIEMNRRWPQLQFRLAPQSLPPPLTDH